MIDVHTHLGRWGYSDKPELTVDDLLRRMDRYGIERSVVLPLVSPECFLVPFTSDDALAASRQWPDRIIPFCSLDPRSGNSPERDFSWLLRKWKDAGCKGLGELTPNLYFDDPMCLNLYRHCGDVGLPITFHLTTGVQRGTYGVADEIGMPRLEKTLQQFPDTVFIGHAMAFWSEISGDVDERTRGGYPKGPVRPGGRVPELLARYPNLYADLSAGSGLNAISKDPEFGYRFLAEFQDKLLFGTDVCDAGATAPIVPWFNKARDEGHISAECYEKITTKNAERVLAL
jgi:predicted TIM-barrel fold metal-dependent hydrolase